MPVTTDPFRAAGVWSDQVPAGPVADVRITEPDGADPTAVQVVPLPLAWFMHDTPTTNWRPSLAGMFAGFQAQLPLVSDPSSRSPALDVLEVIPATAQSAVFPGAGFPHATEVAASTVLGNWVDWAHAWVDWVRSPVHTAAAPVAVPMATHVVVVHEIPVTEDAPVGKVVSAVQVLAPNKAIGTVMTVASVGLDWSPVAVAKQVVAVGQVMVATEVTAVGRLSVVSNGDHRGIAALEGSPPSRSTPGDPPELM
jgi:hypothetical protein